MPLNPDPEGKVTKHRSFCKCSVQAGLFRDTQGIILFLENGAIKSHHSLWIRSD